MLGLVAVLAVVFLGIAAAFRQNQWAVAFTSALVALTVLLLIYAIFFLFVWIFTLFKPQEATLDSPFRQGNPALATPGLSIRPEQPIVAQVAVVEVEEAVEAELADDSDTQRNGEQEPPA